MSRTEDRFAIARAEEELRSQLKVEKARSAALERDLEALRSSEAFRIGHALVEGLLGRLRWNVRALRPAIGHWLRRGAPGASSQESVAHTPTRGDVELEGQNVVLFIAWGMDEADLEQHVERVNRLQAMLIDVQPLFVVDTTAFDPIRERGYPVEYLIPLVEWRERRPPQEWGAYVTQRISALREEHRPRTVIVLDGPSSVTALEQGVINSILLPGLGETDDNDLDR